MSFLYKRVLIASDDEDDDKYLSLASEKHEVKEETENTLSAEKDTLNISLIDLCDDSNQSYNESFLLPGPNASSIPQIPSLTSAPSSSPPLTPAAATAAMNRRDSTPFPLSPSFPASTFSFPSSSTSDSHSTTAVSAGDSAGPPAAADWDHNDDIMDRRELLIYALPLTSDGDLTFLPVTPWTDASEGVNYAQASGGEEGKEVGEGGGISTKIKMAMSSAKASAEAAWDSLKESDDRSLSRKIYNLGQKVIQNLSPEERMVKDIPDNISKVIIFHPLSISPDKVMEDLQSKTKRLAKNSIFKATAAALLLPIAFGIDILIIPGPQVLTYYSLWELYKNSSSATGTGRLTHYISQRGDSNNIRVNYAGDERLDLFLERARFSGEGILSETDVEEMASALKEPGLLEPLLLLRERYLKSKTRSGSKEDKGYVRLANEAVDDHLSYLDSKFPNK
mmetsp:Transcript_2533/g.3831  ORF Transcript_2533/g.3831 Transcript_2533/m.3831 type:complete len:451 (-) Transcript_2533:301-1653(-)